MASCDSPLVILLTSTSGLNCQISVGEFEPVAISIGNLALTSKHEQLMTRTAFNSVTSENKVTTIDLKMCLLIFVNIEPKTETYMQRHTSNCQGW